MVQAMTPQTLILLLLIGMTGLQFEPGTALRYAAQPLSHDPSAAWAGAGQVREPSQCLHHVQCTQQIDFTLEHWGWPPKQTAARTADYRKRSKQTGLACRGCWSSCCQVLSTQAPVQGKLCYRKPGQQQHQLLISSLPFHQVAILHQVCHTHTMSTLQAIKYARGSLELLDQRLLPHTFTYLPVPTVEAAFQQIKDMVVRGAPAIGCTGVLTLAMDLVANKGAGKAFTSAAEALAYINKTADYLVTSRPTAVNLADGLDKVKAAAAGAAAAPGASPASVVEAVVAAAEAYFEEDLTCNKDIGRYGAAALLEAVAAARPDRAGRPVRVLTHCNTGSLATAGYGTALGVIRALHEQGRLEHAYCTETRPYNQGARLTAFELVHEGIPATLVCDSATCYLMAEGQVDAVVVGADRVVANGDTANKIGTYMLAVVAAHHGVPFFVAAPTTTLDPSKDSGAEIEIEQRPAEELTHFKGSRVVTEGIKVWNPSFDVAPGSLIAGIITQRGVVPKQGGQHKVREFLRAASPAPSSPTSTRETPAPPTPAPHLDDLARAMSQELTSGSAGAAAQANGAANGDTAAAAVGRGFYALNRQTICDYIVAHPQLLQHVGSIASRDTWRVDEVGDGNMNFVFIVEGPVGGLAIKQCPPYVRCVGESWPITQDRIRIETEVLQLHGQYAPEHVPAVYLYDPGMVVLAMTYIAPPAIILRKGLMQGVVYPQLAAHMSTYMANTLFHTSVLALPSQKFRDNLVHFNNPELCALTEQVIFTEPYIRAANNRHTSPQLDADVEELRADGAAKVAISALKRKFITCAEALLHGDLHTGSIMVTDGTTHVIDPEFAYVGPIAFDVAKFLANMLLALFASYGQEAQAGGAAGSRDAQRAWTAECVASTWQQFDAKFRALWSQQGGQGGLYPGALLGPDVPQGPASLAACQDAFMRQLWADSVGFMGAFFIRRLVGIAHVADMDSITDPEVRASCERRALRFGRALLTQGAAKFPSVDTLVSAAVAAAAP